jgi:hypothetical protein
MPTFGTTAALGLASGGGIWRYPTGIGADPYRLETGVRLLIANDPFLHHDDFTGSFVEHGTNRGTASRPAASHADPTVISDPGSTSWGVCLDQGRSELAAG